MLTQIMMMRWFDCITFPFKSVSQLITSLVRGGIGAKHQQTNTWCSDDRRVAVAHGAVSREASLFFLKNNE